MLAQQERHQLSGYTLIELVIYTALFVILSLGVVSVLWVLAGGWEQARVQRLLSQSGTTALERVLHEVRLAKAIRQGESTFNANPGTLSLDTYTDPTGDVETAIKFFIQNDQLMVQEDAGAAAPLTPNTVQVTSFKVWEVAPADTGKIIRLELAVTGGAGTRFSRSATFTTSAILRSSYPK